MNDYEYTAWLWLLALPRVPWPKGATGAKIRELHDRQIKISVCPGNLNQMHAMPGVKVSILLPGYSKRITGTGNSLYVACERAQGNFWRAGLQFPFLSVMHLERQKAKLAHSP